MEQIDAAARLHSRLPYWEATDKALDDLSSRFPEFDLSACLLKTVAINQLYGTNVLAATRMARHVESEMSKAEHADLVEDLATVRFGDKVRRHVSFASKFAHFFVDKETYPIFDSYAADGLRRRLSNAAVRSGEVPLYRDYVAAHRALRDLANLPCSGRELDQYLWLSGLYRTWERNRAAPINVEASGLFASATADPVVADDLRRLSGAA
jgi:hypothetical protein